MDSGFTASDTATFGTSGTTGNPTVALDDVRPSLKALRFDNPAHAFTLAKGTGTGVLKLDNGSNVATVTVNSGAHAVTAPLELHSNLAVDVAGTSSLALGGAITESGGARTLTKSGAGTLNLTGGQFYNVLTTTGGTTHLATALGSGSSTVNANATTVFHETQKLAALSIGSGSMVSLTSQAVATAPFGESTSAPSEMDSFADTIPSSQEPIALPGESGDDSNPSGSRTEWSGAASARRIQPPREAPCPANCGGTQELTRWF